MKNLILLFMILAVIAIVLPIPLALIWALNTLFVLGIEYTFLTWLAALLLGMLFGIRPRRG